MKNPRKNPRLPLLIGGVVLLGCAAALYVAGALAAARPLVFLAGGLLVALYFVVGRMANAPVDPKTESRLFEDDASTSMELRDADGNPRR